MKSPEMPIQPENHESLEGLSRADRVKRIAMIGNKVELQTRLHDDSPLNIKEQSLR